MLLQKMWLIRFVSITFSMWLIRFVSITFSATTKCQNLKSPLRKDDKLWNIYKYGQVVAIISSAEIKERQNTSPTLISKFIYPVNSSHIYTSTCTNNGIKSVWTFKGILPTAK
jgi:hypothetical protein